MNLTADRVRLRALETRDLDAIWAAQQDFDLQLTTDGDAPPLSDEQTRAFWLSIISDPGPDLRYFAIEALESGAFVGACSLQHIDLRNRRAELSIWLAARPARGQGYGTEATRLLVDYGFEVLRLDKIHLGVYDFNEAGMRTYERVGFRYEGRLRQMLHYDGRYWDEWAMGLLREEWERLRQPTRDGLRPYHPGDLDAAVALIASLTGQDAAAARQALRGWWRQIDRVLYGYQVAGALVGLLTLDEARRTIYDLLADAAHESAMRAAAM